MPDEQGFHWVDDQRVECGICGLKLYRWKRNEHIKTHDETEVFRVAVESKPKSAGKLKSPDGKCMCGCGGTVTSRFLPGHDAKLKSQLINEALEGSAAAEKRLNDLGWADHLAKSRESRNGKAEKAAAKKAERDAARAERDKAKEEEKAARKAAKEKAEPEAAAATPLGDPKKK